MSERDEFTAFYVASWARLFRTTYAVAGDRPEESEANSPPDHRRGLQDGTNVTWQQVHAARQHALHRPRDLVFPPDKSREDVEKDQNADFKRSEDSAEYAALGYLKYPSAVRVEKVG